MSLGECVCFLNFLLVCLYKLQALFSFHCLIEMLLLLWVHVCVCLCVLGNTGTSHCLTDSISRFVESYVMGIHKSCPWSLRSPQHAEEMRQCLDFRGVCGCVCVCSGARYYHHSCNRSAVIFLIHGPQRMNSNDYDF